MELRRVWTDTTAGAMHTRIEGEHTSGRPVVLVHGMIISSRYINYTAPKEFVATLRPFLHL
jgi:hypothetical protein